MPDEIRVNRPAQQMPVRQEGAAMAMAETSSSSSKTPWIILALIVVVIAILAFVFRDSLFGKGKTPAAGGESASAYQAVFLTNGQVYFGKLSNPNGDYITLDDIYYLQVGPTQGSGATSTPQNISLVKLGNELHGPVDQMHISRNQVLFYEDLKPTGGVVTAIVKDKAGQK